MPKDPFDQLYTQLIPVWFTMLHNSCHIGTLSGGFLNLTCTSPGSGQVGSTSASGNSSMYVLMQRELQAKLTHDTNLESRSGASSSIYCVNPRQAKEINIVVIASAVVLVGPSHGRGPSLQIKHTLI